MNKPKPKLIAIVGGSGSGKTWLAGRLEKLFARNAVRLSLDDFYRDRSRVAIKRRAAINFDHPRAVDWEMAERVLKRVAQGRPARAPRYNFATHTRDSAGDLVQPKPLVIVDGLWLLRRRALRKLFSCRIFIDCPSQLRLHRRLRRDAHERGRHAAHIRRQFLQHVDPMHQRFVRPQQRLAHLVLTNPDENEVKALAEKIKTLLELKLTHERRRN